MIKKDYKLKISTSNVANFSIMKELIVTLNKKVKVVILPKKIKRIVILKSPHVNKKAKEHFQIIKYRRLYYLNFSKFTLKSFIL